MVALLAKIALGAAGAGGKAGAASAAGKTGAGTIAKGVILSQAMLKVAKDTWRVMSDVSGHLKSSMNIMKKSIQLFIKPIADTMGLVLRPFALLMMQAAIPFYRAFLNSGMFKAILTPSDQRTEKEQALATTAEIGTGLVGGAIAGAGIGSLGGPAGAAIGAIIGAFVGGLLGMIPGVIRAFENIKIIAEGWLGNGGPLREKLDGFFGKFGINMDETREKLAKMQEEGAAWYELLIAGFGDMISQFWGSVNQGVANIKLIITEWAGYFLDQVRYALYAITDFFTVTIPGWITTGWDTVQEFVTVTVPAWVREGFETLRDFFTKDIPKWFTEMVDKIKDKVKNIGGGIGNIASGAWSGIKSFGSKVFGGKAGGGFARETGMYPLHAGEFVMRAGQVENVRGEPSQSFAPNITVNADVNKDIDIRYLADELNRLMEVEYRRKVSY